MLAQARHDSTSSRTRIQNPRRLMIARGIWVVLVLAAALLFILGMGSDIQNNLRVCPQPPCEGVTQPVLRMVDPRLGALLPNGFWVIYFPLLDAVLMVVWFISGVVLFWLRSDDWVVMCLSLAFMLLGAYYGPSTIGVSDAFPALRLPLLLVFACGMSFTLVILYTFPDGHFVPGWTRWVILPFALWELMRGAGFYFRLPFYVPPYRIAIFIITLVFLGTGMYAQVYRYRRETSAIRRQQSKWFVLGVSAAILGHILSTTFLLLFTQPHIPVSISLIVNLARPAVEHLLLILIPLTVGFAMLRYRLWDVDLVINRSLVGGVVTALLALIFLGGLLILKSLLELLLGDEQTTLAAMVSTGVVALLFGPTRRAVRHFVDRRLYGFRFDLNDLRQAGIADGKIERPGALTGTTLGAYDVLGLIGKGGMGEIYRGQAAGETVALKILPPELATRDDMRERFSRESRALLTLDHPNIVRLRDFGESRGIHYIALDLVEGRDLSAVLDEYGRLPLGQACTIIRDIAAALDHAHQRGLVHRDVKSSNVLLQAHNGSYEPTYSAILTDFGIAKLHETSQSLTGTGAVGTIDYMAPEQIMTAREVDGRADVYALGVIFYEMLTGQRPFQGNAASVLFAHLQQPPPDPRDMLPELPPHIVEALHKALAKNPDERWPTAGALADALG